MMYLRNKLFIVLLPFLAAVFALVAVPANAQTTTTYIVQLAHNNAAVLEQVGSNIQPQFSFSSESTFQNIYLVDSTLPLSEFRAKLGHALVYVEPDQELTLAQNPITNLPNDPSLTNNSANIDRQWGLAKANFLQAWYQTTGSPSVVVAVIDTGIDSTHEDFTNTNFVDGFNLVAGTPIRAYSNSDDNGHGTLVAGVIGATANNRIGIAGASFNTSLMAVKALNTRGSGTSSRISQAIVWATDNGASVINLSLGGVGFAHDTTLANAITYAFERNVVIIAAAGNDVAITGGNLDIEPVFPICNDNSQNMVIGVTATDSNDLKPDFA
ncbi:MAG TPA: S8 family serine peptidase, partial [Candidatus Doudnabacteria bacterium]|nr:S8 family serine peptidase [Candidatus Doudnabacteria bacterium]